MQWSILGNILQSHLGWSGLSVQETNGQYFGLSLPKTKHALTHLAYVLSVSHVIVGAVHPGFFG